MADKEINNQKDFFQEVRLDANGDLITISGTQVGETTAAGNAYNFFKRIALDENGKVKTVVYMDPETPFVVANSFLFDGVNDSFHIDNAELTDYFQGVGKSFSINTMVKRNALGNHYLFENLTSAGILLRFNSANVIDFLGKDSGASKSLVSNTTYTDLNEWLFITASIDGTTPLNSKIFVNGVDVSGTNNLTGNIDTSTTDFNLGHDEYMNMFAVYDRALSLSEHQTLYNSGQPTDPQDVTNCVYSWIPDNTYEFDSVNSEWAVPNVINTPNIKKAFTFDNVDDYLTIAPVESMKTQTSGTIRAVLNVGNIAAGFSDAVFNWTDDTDWLVLRFFSNTVNAYIRSGGVNAFSVTATSAPIPINSEVVVHLVQDGVEPKIYINGVFIAQSFSVSTDKTAWLTDIAATKFNIGEFASSHFGGNVKEVSYLTDVLTAGEVLTDYNNGNPLLASEEYPSTCLFEFNPDNAYTFDSANTEYGVPNGVELPELYTSHYQDGINNFWSIPYSDLGGYLNGANLKFSMSFFVKRDSISSEHSLLTNWITTPPQSVMMRILANDKINFTNRLSASNGSVQTTNTFTDTDIWYGITFTFDHSQALGSRGKIYVNGVDEAVTDTLKDGTDISASDFYLMSRQFGNYFEGTLLHAFLTDDVMTLSEHQDWYNNGVPTNPTSLGSRVKWNFNPLNSVWNGSNFINTDSDNSIVTTSANMVETELKYRAPNIVHSVGMIETSLKYRGKGISYSENMIEASKVTDNPY